MNVLIVCDDIKQRKVESFCFFGEFCVGNIDFIGLVLLKYILTTTRSQS